MSSRIWRIARRRVMESLGLVQGSGFRTDSARRELEEFLRSPGREAAPPRSSGSPEPTPSPPHPYQWEYRLLGAPVGSNLETVQRCWRLRVRETHPDRFAGDPEKQRRASERLRCINEAYDRLRKYLAEG